MQAYLIAGDETEPGIAAADALVIDGRAMASPSSPAEGEAVAGGGRHAHRLFLRIDHPDVPDLDAALAAAAFLRPDAIVLPAGHGRDVAHLGARLAVTEAEHGLSDGGIGIVALLADAAGVLAAASFAGSSRRLRALGWDATALARQLGLPDEAWTSSPLLARARATTRLAAAAADVVAIEAAYPGGDSEGFRGHVAAARRDGFGAMFARDTAQARVIRAAT